MSKETEKFCSITDEKNVIFALQHKITYSKDYQYKAGSYRWLRDEIRKPINEKHGCLLADIFYDSADASSNYTDDLENCLIYNLQINTENFDRIVLRRSLDNYCKSSMCKFFKSELVDFDIKYIYKFSFDNRPEACADFFNEPSLSAKLEIKDKNLKAAFYNSIRSKIVENIQTISANFQNQTNPRFGIKILYKYSKNLNRATIKYMLDGIISACHQLTDSDIQNAPQEIKTINNVGFLQSTKSLFSQAKKSTKWNPNDHLLDYIEIENEYDANSSDTQFEYKIFFNKIG